MRYRRIALIVVVLVSFGFLTPAQAWTRHMVPIQGTLGTNAGFLAAAPDPLPFVCPVGPTGFLLGWIRVQGTGAISRLGLSVFDNFQCAWVDVITGEQKLYGEVVFQAVDPDRGTIQATYDGDVTQIDPAHIVFHGVLTFVGGTGCFAGATGWAPYSGGYSFLNQVGFYDFKGRIKPVRHCLER